MLIREAQLVDIAPMSVVRLAVKENVLSNPMLVTYDDYVDHLSRRDAVEDERPRRGGPLVSMQLCSWIVICNPTAPYSWPR